MSPRGRRPGSPDTRATILAAAQESFGHEGFAGTTIRGVAASAGVDAALVHHYFGTKEDLFLASLQLPVDPREVLQPALDGSRDEIGVRLVAQFLSVWDDPDYRPALLAVTRAVVAPGGRQLAIDGFIPAIIGPVLAQAMRDRPEVRVPLVASQMVGLIVTRYLIGLEPMASMPAQDVAARIGPTIQRYLVDDLP